MKKKRKKTFHLLISSLESVVLLSTVPLSADTVVEFPLGGGEAKVTVPPIAS